MQNHVIEGDGERTRTEEVGHSSCHIISLAHTCSVDSATFIHLVVSLLPTFVYQALPLFCNKKKKTLKS